MKKRTEENRRNLAMIAPTWTLTGLALTACIDDLIDDEINARLPRQPGVISFDRDPSTGDLRASAVETNQVGRFEPLTTSDIAALYADVELPSVMDNQITYEIDVISPTTARITIGIEGQQPGTIDVEITGDDAGDVIFFQDGGNAGIRTVNVLDYENPRDANTDNTYEVSLTFTTQDSRVPADSQSLSENFVLRVTDSVGDDEQSANVREGNMMILSLANLNIADATISGVDAAYVEVAEVNGQMVVRFRSAPDYEAPGDSDRDNTYEFTLTDTDTDVETHIRVMVTNDPSDDQPAVTPTVMPSTTILPTAFNLDIRNGFRVATVRESVSTTTIELRQFESPTISGIVAEFDHVPLLPAGVTENQVTYSIEVTGDKTATLTAMIEGHPDRIVNVAITGDDADSVRFFDDDRNDLTNDVSIRSTHAFDYENPLDANADNIYEYEVESTYTRTNIVEGLGQDYRVEVTNDPSDDQPAVTPDPVVRTTTILPTIVTFSPPDANTGISSAEVRESVSTTAIELRQFEPLTPSDIEALYDSIPLPAGVTENQVTYDISVTGARAATVTIMIVGHADATVNVAITGNDADDIEFVADGGNAGIRSTHAFDYENPLDANADNIYEASLTFTTTDTRIPTNLRSIDQEYRVEVTNDPSDDLPSQAPPDVI